MDKRNKHKLFLGVKIAVSAIIIFTLFLSVLTYITTPYIKPKENILSYESLVLENTQTDDGLEILDFAGDIDRSKTLQNICNVLKKNKYQYISKPKGLYLTLRMEGEKNYLLTVMIDTMIDGELGYTRVYDIYKYKDEYYVLNFQHSIDPTFLNGTGTCMAVYKVVNSELFKEIENYKEDMFIMRHFPFWLWTFIGADIPNDPII